MDCGDGVFLGQRLIGRHAISVAPADDGHTVTQLGLGVLDARRLPPGALRRTSLEMQLVGEHSPLRDIVEEVCLVLRFAKATEAGQALVAILQVNGEVGSVLVERVPLLRFSTASWSTKKRRPAARRTRRHRILQIPPMITG